MKPGDVKRLVRRVLTQEKVDCELAVIFVEDEMMSALNEKYRSRKCSTDVLAFPMQEGEDAQYAGKTLGDIFVCVDRAREQAGRLGHSFREELVILVLHGLYHLLGYGHRSIARRIDAITGELRR